MNKIFKCGITQKPIPSGKVTLVMITAYLRNKQIWDNEDGRASYVPFHACSTRGFFTPVGLPVDGVFIKDEEFIINPTIANVISIFTMFRSLYHRSGFQNENFNICGLENGYPKFKAHFKQGKFTLQDLFEFNEWDEFSKLSKDLIKNILLNQVPIFMPIGQTILQSHLMVIGQDTYDNLLQLNIPNSSSNYIQNIQTTYSTPYNDLKALYDELSRTDLSQDSIVAIKKSVDFFNKMHTCSFEFTSASYGSNNNTDITQETLKKLL